MLETIMDRASGSCTRCDGKLIEKEYENDRIIAYFCELGKTWLSTAMPKCLVLQGAEVITRQLGEVGEVGELGKAGALSLAD
jgi:hypothetical protein